MPRQVDRLTNIVSSWRMSGPENPTPPAVDTKDPVAGKSFLREGDLWMFFDDCRRSLAPNLFGQLRKISDKSSKTLNICYNEDRWGEHPHKDPHLKWQPSPHDDDDDDHHDTVIIISMTHMF